MRLSSPRGRLFGVCHPTSLLEHASNQPSQALPNPIVDNVRHAVLPASLHETRMSSVRIFETDNTLAHRPRGFGVIRCDLTGQSEP